MSYKVPENFQFDTNEPKEIADSVRWMMKDFVSSEKYDELQELVEGLKKEFDDRNGQRFTWYINAINMILIHSGGPEKDGLNWVKRGFSKGSETAFGIAISHGFFELSYEMMKDEPDNVMDKVMRAAINGSKKSPLSPSKNEEKNLRSIASLSKMIDLAKEEGKWVGMSEKTLDCLIADDLSIFNWSGQIASAYFDLISKVIENQVACGCATNWGLVVPGLVSTFNGNVDFGERIMVTLKEMLPPKEFKKMGQINHVASLVGENDKGWSLSSAAANVPLHFPSVHPKEKKPNYHNWASWALSHGSYESAEWLEKSFEHQIPLDLIKKVRGSTLCKSEEMGEKLTAWCERRELIQKNEAYVKTGGAKFKVL